MKKLYLLYITFALTLLFNTSCRDEEPTVYNPQDYSDSNFSEVFESFWNGMNNNYVFWDIDKTDWDEVYSKYALLFWILDINKEEDVKQAYSYFKEMTANIVDSHFNLSFTNPLLADSVISPAMERKKLDKDYHGALGMEHYYNVIPRKYLGADAVKAQIENEDNPDEPNYLISGTIENDIAYLHFDSFKLTSWVEGDEEGAKDVLDYFFTQVEENKNLKGIIIDVRDNGGGDLRDLNLLLGNLIKEKLYFGETRAKQGNGRLDYTPWMPAYVTPQEDTEGVDVPIVVLANNNSVSMAEITTMAIHTLPNGTFVGETTWGGEGPLTENVVFSGGQFSTRFMKVYTSSLMLRYIDGKIYEGIGFSPDVEVKHNQGAINRGEDPQLEKAIEVIKAK